MRNHTFHLFNLLLGLFLCGGTLYSQSLQFECNGHLYLTQFTGGGPTNIYDVEVIGTVANFLLITQHPPTHNSAGYNRYDNYIYALDPGPRIVYRLFANGTLTNMGSPPGLGSTGGLVAGDCDTNGQYLVSGGGSGMIFTLDVTGATATVTSSVSLNVVTPGYGNVNFWDMAFHPYTNVLYAFDQNADRLITINPSNGNVVVFGMQQPGITLGALFFDAFGDLYGYSTNSLYKVDINTGAVTFVAQGPSGSGRDGCSCPYTVSLQKEASVTYTCPGDTFFYTLKIANRTGITLSDVHITDYMDPRLTITSISNIHQGNVQPGTGIGTSTLRIDSMDFVTDTATITVGVVLDPASPGGFTLANQAYLTNVPVVTTDTAYSDDPTTSNFGDSTRVNVYPVSKSIPIISTSGGNCIGDTYNLIGTLNQSNTTYTWFKPNDDTLGSNAFQPINGLYFSDSGWYKVRAIENGCTEIWDSVFVSVNDCGRTFECLNDLKLTQSSGTQTQLNSLTYPGQINISTISNYNTAVNAIGFNHHDGCYYGYNTNSNDIYRMLRNGTSINLNTPAGLYTASGSYEAGACDSSGLYYIAGSSGYLAEIEVRQTIPDVINSYPLSYSSGGSGAPGFEDIAFQPMTNTLYGFDQNTEKLATINVSNGNVAAFGTVQSGLQVDGLFFNTFGELYGYGNGQFYRFDPSTGATTLLDNGPSAAITDGCSCPYGVGIQKRALPTALCPGDTFRYALKIFNNSGTTLTGLRITDQLDPRLKVVSSQYSISGQPTANSGPNTSSFGLQNVTLPPDTTTIWITATNWAGYNGGDTLWNQAILQSLPPFYGLQVQSNFAQSTAFFDPTPIYFSRISFTSTDTSICEGNQVWAGGQLQGTSGVYRDTFPSQFGCDSTVVTTVTVNPVFLDTNWVEICPGAQYFAGGQWQTTNGWYTDIYATQSGCDSTIVTRLDVRSSISTTLPVSICNGDQYYAGGQWRSSAGTYYDTLTSAFGCDSVVITNLSIVNAIHTNRPVSICQGDSLFAGNAWRTLAGTYNDTLLAVSGCDSIVHTQLTTIAPVTGNRIISICLGDSLFAGGTWQQTAGTYIDTLAAASSCDSILTTQLSIIAPVSATRSAAICAGDSFFVGGAWQKNPGNYVDTLTAVSGCDSILTTQLTISQLIYITRTPAICPGDSLFVGGAWQDIAGTYRDTLIGGTGCDSIITTQLSITSVPTTTLNFSRCQGDSILAGGSWRYQSGTFRDTLTGSTGCDSILVSQVTFHPTYNQTISSTICAGDSLWLGGAWQKTPGLYLDTYQTTQGCDSLVYTNLSVTPIVQTSWDTTVCEGEPVRFAGQVWTMPGVYHDTTLAANGCDSIASFTLNTWALPQPNLGPEQSICQGGSITLSVGSFATYSWSIPASGNSVNVNQGGTYSITVTDNNGCLGSDAVDIVVKPNPSVNLGADIQICPHDSLLLDVSNPNATYQWNTGDTLAAIYVQQANSYSVTVTMDGCTNADDITLTHFIPLTVELQPDTTICIAETLTLDATTAGAIGYAWSHGPVSPIVELSQDGTYIVSITDANGCTSSDDFVLTKEYCRPEVTVPTGFSPNGDGNNDLFLIPNQNITFIEVRIYNRWGNEVFQTTNPNQGWDGTYGGEPQPIGLYIFVFRYLDETGRPFLRQGNLTLIR